MIDNILLFAMVKTEHGSRLIIVFEHLQQAGITLNQEQCRFSKTSIRFSAYIIDWVVICPHPAKIEAHALMPPCQNVTDVQRFLNMANQLGEFTPNLTTLSQTLRELLKKDSEWFWNYAQQTFFDRIKAELSSPEVLACTIPTMKLDLEPICHPSALGQ